MDVINDRPGATPRHPAGAQLRWFLRAVARLPIPDAVVRGHFDRRVLAVVPPAELSRALAGLGQFHLVSVTSSRARSLVVVVRVGASQRLQLSLTVDAQGLISGLWLQPASAPTSWAGVDKAARSVVPEVRLLVAEVTSDTCRPIHVTDAGTPAPLGSVSKL